MSMRLPARISYRQLLIGMAIISAMPFLTVELFKTQFNLEMETSAFLVFHNVAEFFSVMVSLSIFGLGWFAYDQSKDRHSLFMSVAFLAIGLIDFMHTLSYTGMPPLITPNTTNKATQFWIAARLLNASAFFSSAFVSSRSPSRWLSKASLMTATLTASAVSFVGIIFFPEYLPTAFIQGVGLTAFKVASEYAIILLLVLACAMYYRRLTRTGDRRIDYYLAAFIVCIFSEIVFARYKSVFDTYNILGHLYKIIAFGLIYKGIFIASITKPYEDLRYSSERLQLANKGLEAAKASLNDSEARFRATFEQAAVGIAQVGIDGRWMMVNNKLCDILGYTREELLTKSFREINHADDLETDLNYVRQVLADEIKTYSLEKRYICRDGSFIWGNLTVSLVRDDLGQPEYFIAVIEEISRRKLAEEERTELESQLHQAQKMESIGRLAGGVAHDFNNMLLVILGHTGIVLEQMDQAHPYHVNLTEIRKAAEHSADLTRQLLAFARKQTVVPTVLDLNEVVAGMLMLLQRLIGEDVQLIWQPAADQLPVKADPSQINQILTNLCVNARDAISDVGKITIETGRRTLDADYCANYVDYVPGDYVKLVVSDNGCGMDKQTLAQIFEPFFTTKKIGVGTGLGLSTVYGIVRQNSGFINVYSELGQGTSFTIYLPRHGGNESRQAKTQDTARPMPHGHETILLVEDEPAVLRLTTVMLEKMGYIVLAANNPGEAIRLARELAGGFHLLMTDIVMPDMNGQDLAKELLSLHSQFKILFMSGYTAHVFAKNGVLDEGVHFIQKPFSMQELADKLREVQAIGGCRV